MSSTTLVYNSQVNVRQVSWVLEIICVWSSVDEEHESGEEFYLFRVFNIMHFHVSLHCGESSECRLYISEISDSVSLYIQYIYCASK